MAAVHAVGPSAISIVSRPNWSSPFQLQLFFLPSPTSPLSLLLLFSLFPWPLSHSSSSSSSLATNGTSWPIAIDPGMGLVSRTKRQFPPQPGMAMCPPQCFSSPMCPPMHCQAYQCFQPQMANVIRCCCQPAMIVHSQPDLKTACDGEEAVAACINGLCGQGYFCSHRKFCCRCPMGKSIGNCVNNLCPPGYACNSNNFCCPLGAGSVLGPCVNGRCPEGYECGAGDLCYARTGADNNNWIGGGGTTAAPQGNPVRRNFPFPRRPASPPFTAIISGRRRVAGEGNGRRRKPGWQRGKGKKEKWGSSIWGSRTSSGWATNDDEGGGAERPGEWGEDY